MTTRTAIVCAGVIAAACGVAQGQPTQGYYTLPANWWVEVGHINTPSQVTAYMTVPLGNPAGGFGTPDTRLRQMSSGGVYLDNDDAGTDMLGTTLTTVRGSVIRSTGVSVLAWEYRVVGYSTISDGPYALAGALFTPGSTPGFSEVEPNNTTATATALNIPASGLLVYAAIGSGSDVDFFRINLNAGDVLAAMTVPLASFPTNFSAPDTVLSVYSSSGTFLFANDNAGSDAKNPGGAITPSLCTGSAVRYMPTASGPVYLHVGGFSAVATGQYALIVTVLPAAGGAGGGGACYANCDQSTTPPVLNVADFSCFLQKFAAGCP